MADNQPVYEGVGEPNRDAYLQARRSGDVDRMTQELLALAFHDPDWRWVQVECVSLLTDDFSDEQSRYIAVLCLGHLANFHPMIEYDEVVPLVTGLKDDPSPRVRERAAIFLQDTAPAASIAAYLPIGEPDRAALAEAREHREVPAIGSALLALAWHDPDDQWVQARCVEALGDPETEVRRVALICVTHLIRERRHLDYPRVLPTLRRLERTDTGIADALDALAEVVANSVDIEEYDLATTPDRHALARAHAEGDTEAMKRQLAALTLEDPDWRWMQGVSLDLLQMNDPAIRTAAVTSLTNLLQLRRELDHDTVVPHLRPLRSDAVVGGAVDTFFYVLEELDDAEG